MIEDVYHNCGRLSCPVCGWAVITDKANDVQDRFENYELLKNAENAVLIPGEKREYKPRHFVFTMSPAHEAELITKTFRLAGGKWSESIFLDLARAELNPVLKISGLIGGVSVYHDSRLQHPGTGQTGKIGKHLIVMEAKLSGNMKDEDPAWKVYQHISKQPNNMDYYYFSPHFHSIAYGKIMPVSEFEELLPGWTYHNKREVKNAGGLARYLFSHMALIADRKSVSWFGRLSSVHLGKEILRTYEEVEICKETGKPWVIVDSIYPDEIGKECTITITEYRYFFRTGHHKKKPLPEHEADYTPEEYDRALKLSMPKTRRHKRPAGPSGVYETGIVNLWKYCDAWGKY